MNDIPPIGTADAERIVLATFEDGRYGRAWFRYDELERAGLMGVRVWHTAIETRKLEVRT